MNEDYGPSSDFLTWVINEDAPLTGSEYGDANLHRVIELTTDKNTSNRDWAAFLLANLDLNTPAIRAALTPCADDPDENVRAEGIRGLARKDAAAALPYVQRALAASSALMDIFEAAAIVAHPSLVAALTEFAGKTDEKIVSDALEACQAGKPHPWYL